jgi:hypothetical protein
MKLSKKLMLFEEFTQSAQEVRTEVAVDTTTQVSQPTDSVRTDIVSDVDSIINKLEDLAKGIGQEEKANESVLITEADGAVASMMSAELYMIPLIAAGVVGGAAVGITVLIKKAIRRAKIRKNFEKNVRKPKLEAAKMEIAMNNLSESDAVATKPKAAPKKAAPKKAAPVNPQDKQAAAKKKAIDQYKQKIEKLKKAAEDYTTALSSKYPKDKDMIAALNADSNMQVAKLMLDNEKALTPSEKKRYEQMYNNAVKKVTKIKDESEATKESGKKAKSGAPKDQIEEVEKNQEELDQAMADLNKGEIDKLNKQIETNKQKLEAAKKDDTNSPSVIKTYEIAVAAAELRKEQASGDSEKIEQAQKKLDGLKKEREELADKEGLTSKKDDKDTNPTKKNSKEDQLQRIDDLIKKEKEKPEFTKKSEEIKTKIGEYEEAIKDLESKKDKSSKDKIGMLQAAIASEKKKLEGLDKENPKLKKLTDLRKKVEMKESWNEYDFDVMIFETQISTLELEYELV